MLRRNALETPQTVIDFWFGAHRSVGATAAAQARLWWGKDSRIDDAIRQRFEASVGSAAAGGLDAWAETADGCLALILLLDQFPRNMYRGTAAAFGYDQRALAWCGTGIDRGMDRQLDLLQRVFFYLPLEHSESPADQARSVMLFERLAAEAAVPDRKLFEDYLRYAMRHRDIVDRFGRFPHRNAIVGRASTQEEEAFLARPGSSF